MITSFILDVILLLIQPKVTILFVTTKPCFWLMDHDEFSFILKPSKPHRSLPTVVLLHFGIQIGDFIFVPVNFDFAIESPASWLVYIIPASWHRYEFLFCHLTFWLSLPAMCNFQIWSSDIKTERTLLCVVVQLVKNRLESPHFFILSQEHSPHLPIESPYQRKWAWVGNDLFFLNPCRGWVIFSSFCKCSPILLLIICSRILPSINI